MTRKRFQKLVMAEMGSSKYWYEIKEIRCYNYKELYEKWRKAMKE